MDHLPWQQVAEACAKPLLATRGAADPHGTVSDYWLHTVRLAAADTLRSEPLGKFTSFFAGLTAKTMPPQVAILLVASPEVLEERIASHGRHDSGRNAVSDDLMLASTGEAAYGRQSGAAVCGVSGNSVAGLLRLQDQLTTALRCPGSLRYPDPLRCPDPVDALVPRAVVTIDAGDLGRAVQEAVAAVEAMA
jgi:hypothetical protein